MSDTPAIPYGFKPVHGQLQKGDGLWNGVRFAKVKRVPTPVTVMKMRYPVAAEGQIAIRRCEVVQAELPECDDNGNAVKCSVCGGDEPCSHNFDKIAWPGAEWEF